MRNPSRTQQNPIFEPLFSQEEELHSTQPTHLIHSSSSEWLSTTYSASPCNGRPFLNNQLRKAPTTIFNQDKSSNQGDIAGKRSELTSCGPDRSVKSELVVCDHGKPCLSISSTDVLGTRSMQNNAPWSRTLSDGNVNTRDDGSVASKLLTSITKSMSSPSLLSCCKESVRETPYQKTLKLRMMKLQHCAEELGSESSDGASIYSDVGDNGCFVDGSVNGLSQSLTKSLFLRSLPSTITQKDEMSEGDATPMMISVRSAPNLRCPFLLSRSSSHFKERSFPPPLITQTLSRSVSLDDSFAVLLRAYREDGRFMLKEVKVPCRQYLQASRKDGRLTLQLFTSDEGIDKQENSAHKGQEDVTNSQIDVNGADICEGHVCASYSSDHKIGVESVSTADVEGDLQDSAEIDEFEGNTGKLASVSDVRKSGDILAKSLLMSTLSAANQGMADGVSHFGAFRMMSSSAEHNIENRPSPSYLPNLPSTRQPPEINPRLKVSGPLITVSQCEENMVLQSKSTRNSANTRRLKSNILGLEFSSASLQGVGFVPERSMSSTIIFKDVGANSLIENVSKLVSSFGQLDGRKGFKNCQLRNGSRYIDGIRIGVKKVEKSGAQTADGVHLLNVECERKPQCGDALKGEGSNINAGGVSTKSSMLQFDVCLPLHLDNWLHNNIHCKEQLFDRNNNIVHKGFPFVAIRS